jgi:hypothetical protein
VYLSPVILVYDMQLVEACGHSPGFSYMGETCELLFILATVVRPVSLWPLITVGNLGVSSCLDVV